MPKQPSRFNEDQLTQIGNRINKDANVTVSNDVVSDMTTDGLPEIPDFPWAVFLLNLIFDVLTFFASIAALTGVGIVIPWALRAFVWVVNAIWFFGKAGPAERAVKRAALKKLTLRILLWMGTDIIPFNDILFPNCALIVMVHYKETAIGKAIWDAVDTFKTEDIPKMIKTAIRETNTQVIRRARDRQARQQQS